MVCLGNICRSPIAEAVFADEVKKRGEQNRWFVDSCATCGYHVGNSPDHRARKVMKDKNVPMEHEARVLDEDDFRRFHFIFGMDSSNVRDITDEAPKNSIAKIEMLGSYDPQDQSHIHDPYYDRNNDGFVLCYERCVRAVNAFLDQHKND